MDEERAKERREQLYKAWDEVNNRQLSNSQIFGKSILSLSSAGLGLSLAFIKNIVPQNQVNDVHFLHWSWTAFIIAIAATLFSFFTSQRGLKNQFSQITCELENMGRHKAEDLEKESVPCHTTSQKKFPRGILAVKEKALLVKSTLMRPLQPILKRIFPEKEDIPFQITEWLLFASLIAYLAAIVLTVCFIKSNPGDVTMTDNKTRPENRKDEGAPKVQIPPDIDTRGAPKVQIPPQPPPPAPTPPPKPTAPKPADK